MLLIYVSNEVINWITVVSSVVQLLITYFPTRYFLAFCEWLGNIIKPSAMFPLLSSTASSFRALDGEGG